MRSDIRCRSGIAPRDRSSAARAWPAGHRLRHRIRRAGHGGAWRAESGARAERAAAPRAFWPACATCGCTDRLDDIEADLICEAERMAGDSGRRCMIRIASAARCACSRAAPPWFSMPTTVDAMTALTQARAWSPAAAAESAPRSAGGLARAATSSTCMPIAASRPPNASSRDRRRGRPRRRRCNST